MGEERKGKGVGVGELWAGIKILQLNKKINKTKDKDKGMLPCITEMCLKRKGLADFTLHVLLQSNPMHLSQQQSNYNVDIYFSRNSYFKVFSMRV